MFRLGIHRTVASRVAPRRLFHSSRVGLGLFGKPGAPASPPSSSSTGSDGGNNSTRVPGGPEDNSFAAKVARRIPRWLRPYTTNFVNAPISHVTSFLILHELSAVVPLIGLWYVFHQNHGYIPLDLPTWAIEKGTAVMDKALALYDFTNYSVSEKAKFLMEGAYAYAITKALFPVRIVFSAALMPWFAKWFVVPFTKIFSARKSSQKTVPVTVDSQLEQTVKTKKIDKPRL